MQSVKETTLIEKRKFVEQGKALDAFEVELLAMKNTAENSEGKLPRFLRSVKYRYQTRSTEKLHSYCSK
ncbi:MAG: hypothetical protein IPK06_04840 [Ignavibacteriae bacterium]|nr:hypothetical protein [Ignavibacteriota bacterium]